MTVQRSILRKLSGQWWINLVYLLGTATAVVACVHGSSWALPRLAAALFAIALSLHVLEELNWPGGFHFMLNTVQGSATPELGPENRLSDLITNLGAELLLIALVVFGGNLATTVALVLFGLGETIVHLLFGCLIFRRLRSHGKRTIYGPGTVTAVLAFLPLAVYTWIRLSSEPVNAGDIAIGVVAIALVMGVLIRLPMILIDGRKHPELAYTSTKYFSKFLERPDTTS